MLNVLFVWYISYSGKASDINVANETRVLLQMGITGTLPCEVKVRTDTILWLKGSTGILRYVLENEVWRKHLTTDLEGSYDIDANFSLVIQNVTTYNDGTYYCEVFDLDTGKVETDELNVVVYGKLKVVECI